MFGSFKIIHVSKIISHLIFFLKFKKQKFVSNLTLEYDLNGLSWPQVGRTHFFEWLATRSRVFKHDFDPSTHHFVEFFALYKQRSSWSLPVRWPIHELTCISRSVLCNKRQIVAPTQLAQEKNCSVTQAVLGLSRTPLLGRPRQQKFSWANKREYVGLA